MTLGPNMGALVAHRLARMAVLDGGGDKDALAREASEWATRAVALIRAVSESDSERNADDETIAAEVLGRLAEKESGT